jgi:hypothetical protein
VNIVSNEFAEVSVRVDGDANSPRLRLEDLRSGRVRFLDALELETLVRLLEGDLRALPLDGVMSADVLFPAEAPT